MVETGKEWRTNGEKVEPFDTTQAKMAQRDVLGKKNFN